MKIRKALFYQRSKVCDYILAMALVGVALAVVEAELTAGSRAFTKDGPLSITLRVAALASTLGLLSLILW